jgi:hypothetical protein
MTPKTTLQGALTEAEIEELVEAVRAGATLSTPGSRCHSTWGFHDGRWFREDFDEGAISTSSVSETSVHALLAEQPDIGIDLLRSRRWSSLRTALAAADHEGALAALGAWSRYGGGIDTLRVASAWLSPAASIADEPTRSALRSMFRDGTLLHLYMDLHGWPKAAGTAARCLDFVDALMARLGEDVPDATALRQRLQARMAAEEA